MNTGINFEYNYYFIINNKNEYYARCHPCMSTKIMNKLQF